MRKFWKHSELHFLKKNYKKLTTQQMANKLGRTYLSVSGAINTYITRSFAIISPSIKPGTKIHNLTVLEKSSANPYHKGYRCKCVCGNIVVKLAQTLLAGTEKYCNRRRCFYEIGRTSFISLESHCKYSAKKRGIKYKLSFEYFKSLISKKCHYCAAEPKKYNAYGSTFSKSKVVNRKNYDRVTVFVNGIDRVKNQIGYTRANCVPCCRTCNSMKLDGTKTAFINHCKKVANFKGNSK